MMKRYNNILLLIMTVLTMVVTIAGCNPDEQLDREEVKLDVMMGEEKVQTRISESGDKFTEGDRFQFFFGTATPSDIAEKQTKYTYSSGVWIPDEPIYWDDREVGETNPKEFCAFLPYNKDNVVENENKYSFSISPDQSVKSVDGQPVNYQASDLLIARVKTTRRLIPIHFWHVLSKVRVNVTADTDANNSDCFGENDLTGMVVKLVGIEPDATIAYNALVEDNNSSPKYNPAVEATASGTSGNITMLCTKAPANDKETRKITASYTAIIPPQTITANSRLITFTLTNGKPTPTEKTYHFKRTTDINFLQGKQTTINVKLYKNKVEISTTEDEIKVASWGEIKTDEGTVVLPK